MALNDWINLLKTIHIIGFVSWFAGMFYLVRIFVYHSEAFEHSAEAKKVLLPQYQTMEKRVYSIIMNPAMMITWTAGLAMVVLYVVNVEDWMKNNGWFHFKFTLLLLLTGYHIYTKRLMKNLAKEEKVLSSFRYRILNEVPTVFLVLITALGLYQNQINYIYLLLATGLFSGLIFYGAYAYKRRRESQVKP